MVIDIHGPIHYKNNSKIPIDSLLYTERIYRRYHKHYIDIDYEYFDTFLEKGMDQNLEKGVELLRDRINYEMKRNTSISSK